MKNQINTTLKAITIVGMAALWTCGAYADGGSDIAKGKAVYEGTCVFCHGEKGKGEIPGTPNFTKPSGVLAQDDAVLIAHIINGFQSPGSAMPMPPKGGNPDMNDEDVEHVLAYIRKEFGKKK